MSKTKKIYPPPLCDQKVQGERCVSTLGPGEVARENVVLNLVLPLLDPRVGADGLVAFLKDGAVSPAFP